MIDPLFILIVITIIFILIFVTTTKKVKPNEGFGMGSLYVPRPNFLDYSGVFCGYTCPPTTHCIYSFEKGAMCVNDYVR
jgi:hypothetical protein